MKKLALFSIISLLMLTACGGGSDTTSGSGGAPELSDKCSIANVMPSSGTTATLTKSSSTLTTSMQITLQEATDLEITSNFENKDGNDWVEAYPFKQALGVGTHSITLRYDLNSPEKSVGDRYTKLHITAKLPDNKACVANLAVNITLNP